MSRIFTRFASLAATTAVLLALAAPALAEEPAASERSAASVLGALRLLVDDQDFDRDRACLRNTGAEGKWTDPGHGLSFILSHDLKEPPLRGDVKVHAPASLEVVSVEMQARVVIVTVQPTDEEGHVFRADDVTCIDVAGFDYVDYLPHGWSVAGSYPAPEVPGD